MKIRIEGDILFVVAAEPKQIRLSGLAGSSMESELVISPGTDLGIEVTEATAQKEQCRITEIVPTGDGKYRLKVVADPSDLPGMLREMITVKVVATDGKEYNTTIPVVIDHMDRISIAPRGNIVFQRRDTQMLKTAGSRPVRRDVQVFSSSPEIRFNVTGVELLDVPEGVFETQIHPVKQGERYRISVFVREYRTEPSIRGRLRILTDDPNSPEKEVRLYAQFGEVPKRPTARKPGEKVRIPDPRKRGGTLQPSPKKPTPPNQLKPKGD